MLDLYAKNKSISSHIIESIYLLCINGNLFGDADVERIDTELDFRTVISRYYCIIFAGWNAPEFHFFPNLPI